MPPAETDRRPVTVLFADLCGFTTMSERLDPEDIRSLQDDLFAEMSAAVRDYDGYVERFVGDSLLALFGAPVAHENDPERAVRAALSMGERTTRLSERWSKRTGEPLALHIGINTGAAVVGQVGTGSAKAYSVTGDVANTASRLQATARRGEIVVGPTTWRLTSHGFAFEPLGALSLKGKAEKLAAYRLVGPLESPQAERGLESHGLAAPLVGRDGELGQMQAAFERAMAGHTQVVRLIGEAGVGKSRLIREFLDHLKSARRLEGVVVRLARCAPYGGPSYGIFGTLLRDAYGIELGDDLETARRKVSSGLKALGADDAEVSRVAPILGYVLGRESGKLGLEHVEPEQLKRQILLAARTLFEQRLSDSPVLLVVEDAHWADGASIELLRFIADRLSDRRLIMLVSHRPSFDGGALAASRADQTAIRLAPFDGEQGETFLNALFGGTVSPLPGELGKQIAARSGGNPLYMEEIVRGMIDDGVLKRRGDGWVCAPGAATVDVPLTVQGLLLARLDRLPGELRRLAQEASVLGPVVNAKLLAAISSDQRGVAEGLERLCDLEFLEELSGPSLSEAARNRRFRFAQTLLQEVVYQNLLHERRRQLHALVGRALEVESGGKPDRLDDLVALGHHFGASPEPAKGAAYLLAAGDWARRIFANDDAMQHYRRGLDVLTDGKIGRDEKLVLHERLGDTLGLVGDRAAAHQHYRSVAQAFESAGPPTGQARLLRKIAALHWDEGKRSVAVDRCERALALLDGDRHDIERAHVLQEMGRFAFRAGDNRGAAEWARKAIAQAEALVAETPATDRDADEHKEAAAALSQAHNTLGIALARSGNLAEAIDHVELGLAVAETEDLPPAACRGFTNLGVLYSSADPAKAIATCERGLAMARKIGDLGFQSRLSANLAAAYCTFTDRCDSEGIAAASASIELDRQLGQRDHLAVPLIVLGQIFQCRGEAKRARRLYEEALAIAEEVAEPQLLFPCYDGLATLYLEQNEPSRAEAYFEKAQAICDRAAIKPDQLITLPFLF